MSPYAPFYILLAGLLVCIGIFALLGWIMRRLVKHATGQHPEALVQAGRRSLAAWVDKP